MQMWTCGDYASPVTRNPAADLKGTKNFPNTRLSDLEQQLGLAETRCGFLKSQLDYMKMLYQGAQPSSEDWNTPFYHQIDSSNDSAPQSLPASTRSNEDDRSFQENSATEDTQYHPFLNAVHNMQKSGFNDADYNQSTLHTQSSEEKKESFGQYLRTCKVGPQIFLNDERMIIRDLEVASVECHRTNENKLGNQILSLANPMPVNTSVPSPIISCAITPRLHMIGEEHDVHDTVHPFQNHILNYSTRLAHDLAISQNLMTNFTVENESERRNNTRCEEPSELRKLELMLKLSGSTDGSPTIKRKKLLKAIRKPKTVPQASSVIKKPITTNVDDSISVTSKIRRKKGKQKNIRAKRMVTTKEFNLGDRKESKKQKQREFVLPSYTQTPCQAGEVVFHVREKRSDVLEIYHNNAVEGDSRTLSGTSSKHSHDSRFQMNISNKNDHNQDIKNTEYQEQGARLAVSWQRDQFQYQSKQQENQSHQPERHQLNGLTKHAVENDVIAERSEPDHDVHGNDGVECINFREQNQTLEKYNNQPQKCCSPSFASRYCDPMMTRNYEQPTVASKMKRVNRSYFTRFNFRNIPFVVGTSVSPSHNLGLNIQQVLSIIKTRQPVISNGNASMLFRQVGKGVRPASKPLDETGDNFDDKKLSQEILPAARNDASFHGRTNSLNYVKSSSRNVTHKYGGHMPTSVTKTCNVTRQESEEFENNNTDSQNLLADKEMERPEDGYSCSSEKSEICKRNPRPLTLKKSSSKHPRLTTSTLLRQRQQEIGENPGDDLQNTFTEAKGIRQVLTDLHDQFEELNTKYEKLCAQAKNSEDDSLNMQIAALEKQLNVKEQEINAFVGLYKEVLCLKQQMHGIHRKKSFISIAAANFIKPIPWTQNYGQLKNTVEISKNTRRSIRSKIHESSTAIRLTGLLREIQSFQKQLLSS